MEEVDEFWDEVKAKQENRDIGKMRREAVQIGAVALAIIADICIEEAGRK